MAEKTTFIKLDRNITEWEWYQDANTFRVFVHLLVKASFKDKKYAGIVLHRGDYITTHERLADSLGLTVQKVRTALGHLKSTGEITITRHSSFLVISLKKYDYFQSDYENQQSDNNQSTINQQSNNNHLTTNQERKEREERKEFKNLSVSQEEQSSENENENEKRQTDGHQKINSVFKEPMLFSAILYRMGSALYQEGYESEEELASFDTEARDVQNCIIPYEFQYHMQNMQNALRFLAGFSTIRNEAFRDFSDAVITCLAEAVSTGMCSLSQPAEPELLIDKLNEINRTVSIGQWLEAFSFKYSRILETSGSTIRNRHGYLKTCAVKYLSEYKASEIFPGFKS